MAEQFHSVIPILRIFDITKAEEFYQEYLGFKVDWDHRYDDNTPLYRQISKGNLILHLSEHHGDGSPGARLRVMMNHGLVAYHQELGAKKYRYMNPGLEKGYGGEDSKEMTVMDPFGNHITFVQNKKEEEEK